MAWDNPDPGVGSIPLIVQVIHTPYLFNQLEKLEAAKAA